ncbi:hypothetical protein V1514DRAFT_346106 [Lipomyces japonicus]|uniref:uncharacterized protein n=1 Tax=Lipomyces japonicus TaxID=56871 RepID=UPI0034CDE4BF
MSIKTPPQSPPAWTHTPDQIASQTAAIIEYTKKLDDEVSADAEFTFESVVKRLANADNIRYGQVNQLTFYQHVSSDKALRDASRAAEEKFREFDIEASMREDLFKAVNTVFKKDPVVDPESKRLLQKINKDFERNGLALPLEKREELKALQKKLSNLEVKYNKALGEENGFILFTEEELLGVPKDIVNSYDVVDGKRKMTFKYPDLFPVMKYAKNPDTRRRAFVGDQNKVKENGDLLIEAVKIRAQIASILGYATHAAYILEERMAKSPDHVLTFLTDLRSKLAGIGQNEIKKLLALKEEDEKALGISHDTEFNVWDYRYFDRLLLEKEYKVDSQKISEYFPLQSTVEKMLSIFENLFALKFVEVADLEKSAWHPDVKQFAVWKDGLVEDEFVGWLYFDLHPRDGKYGHAANFNLSPGYTDKNGKRVYPVTALVCNFSKPTADKPSLLKHDEVVTFFHELGHGIHDLVSVTTYGRFHGTNVARDFVEAPSQMLEYWCWQPTQLKSLSSHYLEPSQTIDENLIANIVQSKHVNGGLFNLRQLHFALFDLKLHTSDGNIDVNKEWNQGREEVSLMKQGSEMTYGYGSFGHLMGGYDSGYYGYLWSQVFAADIFYTKFKANPMYTPVGLQYRDTILKRGGSREELDNLKELLGREPNNDAFLHELGVGSH